MPLGPIYCICRDTVRLRVMDQGEADVTREKPKESWSVCFKNA